MSREVCCCAEIEPTKGKIRDTTKQLSDKENLLQPTTVATTMTRTTTANEEKIVLVELVGCCVSARHHIVTNDRLLFITLHEHTHTNCDSKRTLCMCN